MRLANDDTEWELANYAFEMIINSFGGPEIDLFATVTNKKCSNFCSRFPDVSAVKIDTFTVKWADRLFYAFSPIALILRVLH